MSISISCPDESNEISSLVLPWIAGCYPSSLQSKEEILEHKNLCSSIDHSPIGSMHKEIQYDLRRMAIALVGIPNNTFTSFKVRAWINDVKKYPQKSLRDLSFLVSTGLDGFMNKLSLMMSLFILDVAISCRLSIPSLDFFVSEAIFATYLCQLEARALLPNPLILPILTEVGIESAITQAQATCTLLFMTDDRFALKVRSPLQIIPPSKSHCSVPSQVSRGFLSQD